MNDIVRCSRCNAKNRLKNPPKGQVPACGKCGNDLPWLIKTTDASFADDIDASVPVLVDFWAQWCGPCRMIAPILEEIASDYSGSIKLAKLNVDENPVVSGQFRVQSIPTLMLFKDGEVIDTFVGAMPKGAMLEKLKPHLNIRASATKG